MRYLIIAARGHLDTYSYLRRQFAGDETVCVLMDRRCTERRRQQTSCAAERRRSDRRHGRGRESELASRGFLIARQAGGLKWRPPWWGADSTGTSSEFDRHLGAKDLARLIVGAIALAQRDKIAEAIKCDALFESLGRELEEGRRYYEKNLEASALAGVDYFDEAIVDILVKDQEKVASKIW